MQAVKNLDIKRYMGRWYEIASFPSRFQPKDGMHTRATYSLNEDGTVNVVNETWSDGKRAYIQGSAYKANPSSNEAKLKILCKQNQLDDKIFRQLVQMAKGEGYDVSKLKKTPHTDPPQEEEEEDKATPDDTKGIWWIKSIFGK